MKNFDNLIKTYEGFKKALNGKSFAILEDNGHPLFVMKYNDEEIITSPILLHGEKNEDCWLYNSQGRKIIAPNEVDYYKIGVPDSDYQDNYTYHQAYCKGSKDVLVEILENKKIFVHTDNIKNILTALGGSLKYLKRVDGEKFSESTKKKVDNIDYKLSYLLTPRGQKDKIFEETVIKNGLHGAVTIDEFREKNGLKTICNINMARKTPYGQVELPKSVYEELRKLNEAGKSAYLGGMIRGIRASYNDYLRPSINKTMTEFFNNIPEGFLAEVYDSLPKEDEEWREERGSFYDTGAFWSTMINFGSDLIDSMSCKLDNIQRTLSNLKNNRGFRNVIFNYVLPFYYDNAKDGAILLHPDK